MTETGPYANASSWMGMALETVRGTAAAAPTSFVPVTSPKITPNITEVNDSGLRGSMVDVYEQIPTVRHDEYSFTTLAYLDTLPSLVRGLLGSADDVSGDAAPYTHTISLLNDDPLSGNQPPSYTFFDYDGYKVRAMAGGQVDELSFKFTATGLVEVTVKVQSLPYVVLGTAVPDTAFSTVQAAPAWACTATVNSLTPPVVDGELDLKRGVKPVHTLGQQGPYKLWAGPLTTSAKLTVINSADVEQNYYINDTAFPLSLLFAPPSADDGESFLFQLTNVKVKDSSQERGGDGMVVTDMDLQPLPNATDAGSGGLSPLQFVAINAQSTTY